MNASYLYFPLCRKSITTKESKYNATVPNAIELYVHKAPNTLANANKASIDDEKEPFISVETLVSSLAQNNSLNNISKIDELTLSELAAEKGPHALGPNEITEHKETESLLSNPSTDHCDRPSIELITIDPNPDNKKTSVNETNDLVNSKDMMSHETSETGTPLPKKGHGPKKSVSFAEPVVPSIKEIVDQKTVQCDSAITKDAAVESIEAQIASKRPSKGNVLNRWNFTNSPEKQMIKSPPTGTNMPVAISGKAHDGTSGGVLPMRGLVADIARKWNMPATDDHLPNNLTPTAKTASDQFSTNQSKSPILTNQPSTRGSTQSNSTNDLLLFSSTQNGLLNDPGIGAADVEESKVNVNSSEQDGTRQSHNVSECSHQQTFAENSLLEEKNPFAYNLEALLNIPPSRSRNQSSERDSNLGSITPLSIPIPECTDLIKGSVANTSAFPTALESLTTSTEDNTVPFVLTLPSATFPENGTVAPLNNGEGVIDDKNSEDAHHFSPRASGIGCISHKWFFPTNFSDSDPFTAFRETAKALRR